MKDPYIFSLVILDLENISFYQSLPHPTMTKLLLCQKLKCLILITISIKVISFNLIPYFLSLLLLFPELSGNKQIYRLIGSRLIPNEKAATSQKCVSLNAHNCLICQNEFQYNHNVAEHPVQMCPHCQNPWA